uniref:Serpin domain-containing protein n=1 Tax=Acrobeloides nanus TaxID=290746 RepID=A0A914D633_9BILA
MSLLEAQADFGLNLLRANPNASSQSTIISPISISIALAMCYVGAKNQTANQISQAIAGDASSDKILDYFSTIMAQLNLQNKSYELDSANRIYVQENFQLLQSYKQILTNKFQGQFENIDFSNSEAAAQNINSFIEQATRGKIKDLIPSDAINDLTRMILTNAIYFKGTWEYKFEKKQTAPKTFYLSENREQQVPMMKIKNPFPYYEDNQVKILGLPYKSQEVFLYVILPKDRFGLSNLLQNITGQQLQNHIQEAHKWHNNRFNSEIRIDVELPRFKIETELSLNDTLKKLGITDAFDKKKADFSGMAGSRNLYVSDVFHKAFIETNEEGSEAAAATGVVITLMSSRGDSFEQFQTFHADHPFLYALATRQGDILFTGTVASLE